MESESIPHEVVVPGDELQCNNTWVPCSLCHEHVPHTSLIDGLCPYCTFLNRLKPIIKRVPEGLVLDQRDVIELGHIEGLGSWEWDILLAYDGFILEECETGWQYRKQGEI
jgi:hypothetical protein